jgi:hypothetical protein
MNGKCFRHGFGGKSNVDDVRARIMGLECATVFDAQAWQEVLAGLAAQERPSALADARRRMATAQTNQSIPVAVETPMIKLEQNYSGHRVWSVNGQRVETWSDYDRCLRCGHKLRSPFSRARGYGKECEAKKIWNTGPIAKLVLLRKREAA